MQLTSGESPHTEASDLAVFFMTNSAKGNLGLTQPCKNLLPTGTGRNINHDLLSQVHMYYKIENVSNLKQ